MLNSINCFALVVLVFSCYSTVDSYTGLVCEQGTLMLACPPDHFINIQGAMFGRTDTTTCVSPAMNSTNCTSSTSLTVARAICQGRKMCEVRASTALFGDPCSSNTYKYLSVQYSCEPCVNLFGDDAACENYYLLGQCTEPTNIDWMQANCSKACFKCQSSVDQLCVNVMPDENCTAWAGQNQCTQNPAWMTAYCKKACGLCEQPTTCVNKVNDSQCDQWYSQAQCTANPNYMLSNCSKSCFQCQSSAASSVSTITCKNQLDQCDYWAIQGQCVSNPGYMIPLCTKSCLGCTADPACVDTYNNCPTWANSGQCSANPVFMFKYCWKSCTQCTGAPACVNTAGDDVCEAFAAHGECLHNPAYMYTNCRLACTGCSTYSNGVPNCVNAYFNDSECDSWASANQCENNTSFMLQYCYKSCTACASPNYIGSPALPGDVMQNTAGYSVILPFGFSSPSIITQFNAYFAGNNSVHLQVWRPNGTDVTNSQLVFDMLVTPSAAGQTQTIFPYCFVAQPNDLLGFTSLAGPSPIGFTFISTPSVFYQYNMRAASQVTPFGSTYLPIVYSISAEYVAGTSCG